MVSIGAVTVFCNELIVVSGLSNTQLEGSAYRIAIVVLLGVNAGACSAIRSHRLIPILSKVEDIFLFIIVHTLDHLWPDQGAFSNDSL